MPQLLDYQTKKITDVPDEQVADAVASGKFGVKKDERIGVVAPDGTRGTITGADAPDAFSNGYTFETGEQAHDAEMHEKYGTGLGNAAAAGGLGLARGATFGLSDQILKHSGAMSSEQLKQLQEQNPTASLAGEIGSVALPGLGVLGKVAGTAGHVAGAGVSLAEHAGEAAKVGLEHLGEHAAEHLFGEGAEGIGSRILTKYAPDVLGAGVEGAMYGAGHEISEAALGDEDLTAQKLIAGAGMGFGIAGGTVAGTLLGKAAIKAVLPDSVMKAIGDMATEKTNAVGKFFDPERSQQQFFGAAQKELNPLTGEKFQAASNRLRSQGIAQEGQAELDLATNTIKQLDKAGGLPNREAMYDRLEGIESKAGTGVGDLLKTADEAVESGKVDKEAFQKLVGGISDEAQENISNKIMKLRENGTISEAQFDSLASTLADYTQIAKNKGGSLAGLQELKRGIYDKLGDRAYAQTAIKPETEILKDIARDVKESIEKGSEFVKKAAGLPQLGAVKDLNQTLSDIYQVKKPLARALGRQEANVNVGGLRFRDIGIGAMAGSVGGGIGGPLGAIAGAGMGVANKLIQSDRGYLMRAAAGDALKQMQLKTIAKITGKVDFDIKAALDQFALSAQKASAKVGGRVADKVGEHVIEGGERREFPLSGVAVQASEGHRAYSAPPPGQALEHPLDDTHHVEPKSKSKADLFKARSTELANMAADADGTAQKIAGHVDHWKAAAPKVSDAVSLLHTKAVGYLYNAMPKDPLAGSMLNPMLSQWTPNSTDIAKFERTLDAVRNPMSLISSLSKGDVSPEQVDAVKTLYPKLYEDVQTQLMEKLSTMSSQIPYSKRVQLSTLFDIPGDVTMTPEFKGAMADIGQTASANEPKPPSPHSVTDKTIQDTMTSTQRILAK